LTSSRKTLFLLRPQPKQPFEVRLPVDEVGCYNNQMNLTTYFRETVAELKQVRWPTREETIRLTIVVLGISVFVGAYVGALDYLFTNLLTFFLK
jgi:preprotein translocase subunit SecE